MCRCVYSVCISCPSNPSLPLSLPPSPIRFLHLVTLVPTDPAVLQRLGEIYDNHDEKSLAFQYYYEVILYIRITTINSTIAIIHARECLLLRFVFQQYTNIRTSHTCMSIHYSICVCTVFVVLQVLSIKHRGHLVARCILHGEPFH